MIGVFLLIAVALAGWAFGLRGRVILLVLAGVWLAGLAASMQPGLAGRFGGGPQGWAAWGMGLALIATYRAGLGWLRARALPVPEPIAAPVAAPADMMGEDEIDRYARHLMLREIGGPGQGRLRSARVLVVGAGGLGSPVLMYLAAAGVGRITVIDHDTVSLSNMQRQIIHATDRIGMNKALSARQTMAAINPHVAVTAITDRLDAAIAARLFADHDLILDGTDNFDTRYLVNAAAVAARKPLIAGAIGQWEGQISLYDPAHGGPCYQCIFPERPSAGLVPACAEAGVAAALPGVIGTMMALEAMRVITGAGATLRGRLVIHDGLYGEGREIRTKPRPDCPICAGQGADSTAH
ncbi:ThiF family adenylyltransferase [Paracoccus sp. p3-h83]|uniref:HesA/MoeB/ThiF family protein n=1 Tax=Paracoccus sp. p3-h83 TaxID=3342805 RepID=UPI0035B8C042